MKKKHQQTNYNTNNAFNQAWQNEMNRCLSQSMFGFVEFGNEYDFSLNEKSYTKKENQKNK